MSTLGTTCVSHLLLAIGIAIDLVSSALAAPIPLPNFSFESPDAPDGDSWFFFGNEWTAGGSGFFQMSVTDFNNSSYAGSSGNNSPLPGTAHGGQAAFIALQSLASVGQLNSRGLAVVSDNTIYTLTVALGNALNFTLPDTSTIQLLVDDIVVSSTAVAATSIPDGTFTDFSTSFSTAAVAGRLTGGTLTIRLQVSGNPSGNIGRWQTDFDNVRLDATPVPEPSTLLLVTGALVGLGMTRLRSREKRPNQSLETRTTREMFCFAKAPTPGSAPISAARFTSLGPACPAEAGFGR